MSSWKHQNKSGFHDAANPQERELVATQETTEIETGEALVSSLAPIVAAYGFTTPSSPASAVVWCSPVSEVCLREPPDAGEDALACVDLWVIAQQKERTLSVSLEGDDLLCFVQQIGFLDTAQPHALEENFQESLGALLVLLSPFLDDKILRNR